MLNTKHKAKFSRMREMRDDLSIIVGAKRSRQITAASQSGSQVGQPSQSPYWSHHAGPHALESPDQMRGLAPSRPSPSANITIDCVPRLVTPTQSRTHSAALGSRYPRHSANSPWRMVCSTPITRTPMQVQPQARSTRTPMSSIFRLVQRPPQTPSNSLSASSSNEILLQSPWVGRDLASTAIRSRTSESTSQLSIQELIDGLRPSRQSTSANITIDCAQRLVTPTQSRTRSAAMGSRCPRQSANSPWGMVCSTPITRTPTQVQPQARSTRTPMSSIFRHVQRPPQTPFNSLSASSSNEILLQSPWVGRDLASTVIRSRTSESTSQLSIQELIDVICYERGQTRPSNMASPGRSRDSLSFSQGRPADFLNLTNLSDNDSGTSMSFLSPSLFENEATKLTFSRRDCIKRKASFLDEPENIVPLF